MFLLLCKGVHIFLALLIFYPGDLTLAAPPHFTKRKDPSSLMLSYTQEKVIKYKQKIIPSLDFATMNKEKEMVNKLTSAKNKLQAVFRILRVRRASTTQLMSLTKSNCNKERVILLLAGPDARLPDDMGDLRGDGLGLGLGVEAVIPGNLLSAKASFVLTLLRMWDLSVSAVASRVGLCCVFKLLVASICLGWEISLDSTAVLMEPELSTLWLASFSSSFPRCVQGSWYDSDE